MPPIQLNCAFFLRNYYFSVALMHQISLHLAVLWLPRINVDADTAGEPINNWRRNYKRVNCDFQHSKKTSQQQQHQFLPNLPYRLIHLSTMQLCFATTKQLYLNQTN